MDKPTFARNLALADKRKILFVRLGLSLLFVALCAAMGLSRTSIDPRKFILIKGTAVVFFATLAYVFVITFQKLGRRLGLQCPSCGGSLAGARGVRALDTGRCLHCGTALF